MQALFDLLPTLITGFFCMTILLVVSGTRYSLKKTLIITIPFTLLIVIANALIFIPLGLEKLEAFYFITMFLPEAILVIFIGKRQKLSLFTGILNAYLAFYIIRLFESILSRYTHHMSVLITIYIISLPLIIIYLGNYYNKLHNIVERSLPKYLWLLILYAISMLVEINVYRYLVTTTTEHVLRTEIFGVAIFSVYVISIVGFYLFLSKYDEKLITTFDNKLYDRQINAILKLGKFKETKENELRILRHDMKHLLIAINGLIQNGETDVAIETINNYVSLVDNTKNVKFCNEPLINSVLDYYNNKCLENSIKFSVKINNFEDILNVSIKELIIVISNCLDNAINASLKVPNNRFVSFIFLNNNGRLILQIKNKYNGKIQIDENNLPTNPSEMHGYGTQSIEMFAKRNNITLDYNITKTTFEITLLFNK
jgi:signal transduction histidine kinase